MKPSRTAVVGAFTALYVLWGSTYLGSKFAMASFPPALLSGIRFIIGGLAMAAVLFATRRLHLCDFARLRWWRNCTIAGALLFAMANVLVSSGVQRIPSGIAALIVAITTALAKWFKGKELSFAFGINLTIIEPQSMLDLSHECALVCSFHWESQLK